MFDFNKLDRYKKFMEEEGIYVFKFLDDWELLILENTYRLTFYSKDDNSRIIVATGGSNWKEFKTRVVNYFLEEEEYEGDVNQDFNLMADMIGD